MEYQNGEGWRDTCTQQLEEMHVVCYNPYKKPFDDIHVQEDTETIDKIKSHRSNGDLDKVHDFFKDIIATDLSMVDRSDFIICYINPDVPTYGTMHELVVANQAKKPIFIFVEGGVEQTPLWLLGLLPPKCFYNNLDEVVSKLKDIDSGVDDIDNGRWRLFKEDYR